MKKTTKSYIFSIFIICSCVNEASINEINSSSTPSTSDNKIMPLGASRVDANRPYFESYRYELWKLLLNSELEFDYVGTLKKLYVLEILVKFQLIQLGGLDHHTKLNGKNYLNRILGLN